MARCRVSACELRAASCEPSKRALAGGSVAQYCARPRRAVIMKGATLRCRECTEFQDRTTGTTALHAECRAECAGTSSGPGGICR